MNANIIRHSIMNRLLIILFLCSVSFCNSYAQKAKPLPAIKEIVGNHKHPLQDSLFLDSIVKEYGEENLFVIIDSLLTDPAFKIAWTRDFEHIYSLTETIELDSILNKFQKETAIKIAIVTIPGDLATKESFDSLTLSIANQWGVGISDGVLIGISKGLRKIRINNGATIETKITDDETKKIIDDIMIPEFKKGDFFAGTKKGLMALMQRLR
jgi:uncharacterized protein